MNHSNEIKQQNEINKNIITDLRNINKTNSKINWDELYSKLPIDNSHEQRALRAKLFRIIDCNGNG